MRVRTRRVLAVLAGGVVLLGGGVTTLASWQDTEFARLPLALSTFNVESSLDGTTWSDADTTTTAKSLVVAVNGSLSKPLTPNGAVTTWVALRAAQRSLGATVTMTNVSVGTSGGLDKGLLSLTTQGGQPALSYEAVAGVEKAACEGNTFTGGTSVVPAGSPIAAVSTRSFTLDPGTESAPGPAVGVCFRLRLADNLDHAYSGASLTPLWTFNATSRES